MSLRSALNVAIPDAAEPSLFFEQYDLEPVFDPKDEALIAALREEWARGEAR